jgi:AbrB family looped-hinge helix DNA binding protein
MAVSTVRNKGQVTIPADVREAAHLEEGTIVEFTVTDDGVLMKAKVQVLVDPEDVWFYSAAWQERHREAIGQVERGDVEPDGSTKDFLGALDKS